MDRTKPTVVGDFDRLDDDFSRLSLSTTSSPAASCNCSFFLPEDLFLSPSPSPRPPPPHPSAANADSYRQRQFARLDTAASYGVGPADNNRLHRIPVEMIQFLNLSLLQGDHKYVAVFFPTVLNEVTNLILDRHDFCVLERFINACDELQRAKLLAAVAADTCTLLRICRDKNGSAILTTLIKHSRSREQISHILRALSPFILDLAKEKPGSDILKCCLNHPYFDRDKYVLQPIVKNWAQLAFDKYGVFIVKQAVDLMTGKDACQLLIEISESALELAQHPSGNYLVQHLLEKRIQPLTTFILRTLRGYFANLSIQKYSSNVVENCLKNTTPNECAIIIRELLSSPNILDIFVDSYGNYVMQSALSVSTGDVHEELLDVVKKNLPTLRQHGYYRRIIRKFEKYRN